ncbi:unnamed protein product, partial [Phaeothamnion confervicola]
MEARSARRCFALGVSVRAAPTPFHRTKVVTLTPRYILINLLGRPMEARQATGAVTPFHWSEDPAGGAFGALLGGGGGRRRCMAVRLQGEGWEWSGGFAPGQLGELSLRLRNTRSDVALLVRVEAILQGPRIAVVFRSELPGFSPLRVENRSLETLAFRQAGTGVVQTLRPYHICPYTWDEPLGDKVAVVELHRGVSGGGSSRNSCFAKATKVVGTYRLDRLQKFPNLGPLGVELLPDGPTRVLRFTDMRLPPAPAGGEDEGAGSAAAATVSRGRLSGAIRRWWTGSGAVGGSSARQQQHEPGDGEAGGALPLANEAAVAAVELHVHLAAVGVSVVDATPRELLYLYAGGASLRCAWRGRTVVVEAEVEALQVDNQIPVTRYPAMLYPLRGALPSKEDDGGSGSGGGGGDGGGGGEGSGAGSANQLLRVVPAEAAADAAAGGGAGVGAGGGVGSGGSGGSAGSDVAATAVTAAAGPLAARVAASPEACVSVRVVQEASLPHITFVRGAWFQLAPFDVNLDGQLVQALLRMATRSAELMDVENPLAAVGLSDGIGVSGAGAVAVYIGLSPEELEPLRSRGADKLYFERAAIGTIWLHVSFVLAGAAPAGGAGADDDGDDGDDGGGKSPDGRGGGGGAAHYSNPLLLLFQAMGATLANIDNAPLRLKAFTLADSFAGVDELTRQLAVHYRGQALRQLYMILGSSELLGNPVGLLQNLGAGVWDFLYEPVAGLTRSPWAFAAGVWKGSSSLVRRTVYSCSDTIGRIAGSLSSGVLASGTVDLRLPNGAVARPRNVLDGILLGLVGALREPAVGVRAGGFVGFARGVGKGGLGLFLKPMFGALATSGLLCRWVSCVVDPRVDA